MKRDKTYFRCNVGSAASDAYMYFSWLRVGSTQQSQGKEYDQIFHTQAN